MATTETIRKIQTLVAGRNTKVQDAQTLQSPNGKPPNAQAGFAVDGAVLGFLGVQLLEDVNSRKARVIIETAVSGSEYLINFGALGTSGYVAGVSDTVDDIVEGLIADAGSTYDALGTLVNAGDGVLLFSGLDGDAYSVVATADGGASIAIVEEATSVEWRRWIRFADSATWFGVFDSLRTDTDNAAERHVIAGIERVYIEILSTNGTVTPLFARCEPE